MLLVSLASQHFNQQLSNVFSSISHGLKTIFGSCLKPQLHIEEDHASSVPRVTAEINSTTVTCVDSQASSCSMQQAQASSPNESLCRFCGGLDHARSVCPARYIYCSFCSHRGHFRSVCERMTRLSRGNPTVSCSAFEGSLTSTVIPVQVNGFKLRALVDTGSTASYIDSAVAEKLSLELIPHSLKISLASSNSVVHCESATQVKELKVGEFCHKNFKLGILPGLCCDVLLGHDLFSKHGNLIVKFGGKENDFVVDQVSHKKPLPRALCNVAKAEIDPPPLFHTMKVDSRPIACKSRRYSDEDQCFIRDQVKELKESGVVEPSSSPWRAQVLVTKDERHKKRMVVDYSRTVNKYTDLDAYPLPRIDDMALEVSKCKFYSTFDLKSAYHQVPIALEERHFTAFEADGELLQFTRIPFGVTNGVSAFQRVLSGIIKKHKLGFTWAYLDNVTVGGFTQEEHDTNVESFYRLVEMYNLTLNHDKTVQSVQEIGMLGYLISYLTIKPDPGRMQPLLKLPVPDDINALKRALGLFSYYAQWVNRFSDKIKPLTGVPDFPLSDEAVSSFENIKKEITQAALACPNNTDPLVVETDASDVALSGTLNQNGRPIAFFSRTLQQHERHHPSIEKEAAAIIESCRKWRHYLCGRRFQLLTDQQAVSFIFNPAHGKTKNMKIERWRVEISCLDFDIKFRPGKENLSADCLSRAVCSAARNSQETLKSLHEGLVHPGEGRLYHFVRSRNLPYSMEDVKKVTSQCQVCARIKPRFYRPTNPPLIKATQPFERLAIDFKGALPTVSTNRYMLTIVDEYSRFPFVYCCKDMTSKTIIKCLSDLFSVFGIAGYIHSRKRPELPVTSG